MVVRIYTYALIDSKSYMLISSNRAIIVDPCLSYEMMSELKENDVRDVKILLTHEHYDHISGIGFIKRQCNNTEIICTRACGKNIQSELKNGSRHFAALMIDKSEEKLIEAQRIEPVTYTADNTFDEKYEFLWEGHNISMTGTPGHSEGSCCIVVDDSVVFTGDSLLKDSKVITRLPGGNRKYYEEKTVPYLLSLDPNMVVYPGHGQSGYLYDFLLRNELTI